MRQAAVSICLICAMLSRDHSLMPLQAALEAVWHVPCGGAIYGDDNLVFIANDWHTALLPVYLQVKSNLGAYAPA